MNCSRSQIAAQPGKRVAIVTGASSGLGREFARQLDARQVADELWLVARNEKALACRWCARKALPAPMWL